MRGGWNRTVRVLVHACVSVFAWGTSAAAQVDRPLTLAPPHLEVGGFGSDTPPDEALAELAGVRLLPDGGIVVGDRIALDLKHFGPDGGFVGTIGRPGQGPEEFDYIYEMDWCAPGVLTVRDVAHVHRYSEALEFLESGTEALDPLGGSSYQEDCHPNGYFVGSGWGDIRSQMKKGYYRATAPVMLLRDGALVRDFGERLSSERIGTTRPDGSPAGSGPHPFGRSTVVALGPGRVYVGSAEDYEIEVYDLEGAPLPPVRWSGPSLDYDEALLDRLIDIAVANAASSRRPRLRRYYAGLPKLDGVPAYDRMVVSDQGQLWVRQFVRPGAEGERWVVFGPDHAPLGTLVLPLRSTLWEVVDDQVVYSVLDDLDVPIVRVSRLRR